MRNNETTHQATNKAPQDTFAIVEIFGHRTHAGLIREVSVAGVGFLEIVTPELPAEPATRREGVKVRRYRASYGSAASETVEEEPGVWEREAFAGARSETLRYHPNAVFSITEADASRAIERRRGEVGYPVEVFTPKEGQRRLSSFGDAGLDDPDQEDTLA